MTTVRFKFGVAGFKSHLILHEIGDLRAFRRRVARTDYASGLMPQKQLPTG